GGVGGAVAVLGRDGQGAGGAGVDRRGEPGQEEVCGKKRSIFQGFEGEPCAWQPWLHSVAEELGTAKHPVYPEAAPGEQVLTNEVGFQLVQAWLGAGGPTRTRRATSLWNPAEVKKPHRCALREHRPRLQKHPAGARALRQVRGFRDGKPQSRRGEARG